MIQFNKKIFASCMQTALVMTLFGMVLQVAKGQLILKLPPPELGFIMGVVILTFLWAFYMRLRSAFSKTSCRGRRQPEKGYTMRCCVRLL
jgi:hypothetical protein